MNNLNKYYVDRNFFNSPIVLFFFFLTGIIFLFTIGVIEKSILATFVVTILLLILGTLAVYIEGPGWSFPIVLAQQFWITFMFRIIVTVIVHLWLVQVLIEPFWQWGGNVGGDEINFFRFSDKWANVFYSGNIWTEPEKYHSDYLSWIYSLGFIRFIGKIFNGDTVFNTKLLSCFFTSLLVPYIYLLCKQIYSKDTAQTAAILAFLLPDFLYLGASLFRGPMVSCLILIVMFQSVVITRKGNFKVWRFIIISLLLFFVIPHLKIWLSILLVLIICLFWVWEKVGKKLHRIILIAILLCVMVLPTFVVTNIGEIVIQNFLYSGESIGLIQRLALERVSGIEKASSNSIGAITLSLPVYIYTPINMVQCLLSIPPWSPLVKFGLIPRAIAETTVTFFWYLIVIFIPAGIIYSIKNSNYSRTIWILGTAIIIIFF